MTQLVRVDDTRELATQAPDIALRFVVSMDQLRSQLEQLERFKQQIMVRGVDYGVIPNTPKPTLLKPGAEKLSTAFGLTPAFTNVRCVEDWDNGLFAYTECCTLTSRHSGLIVASASGSCNSLERRFRRRDSDAVYELVNTVLKMAQKRALVAAVLIATGGSGTWTQDIEDMEPDQNMVVRDSHALWKRWLQRVGEAQDKGIRAPNLKLPIAYAALESAGIKLAEQIKKRDAELASQDAARADGKAKHDAAEEQIASVKHPLMDELAGLIHALRAGGMTSNDLEQFHVELPAPASRVREMIDAAQDAVAHAMEEPR